MLLHYFVLSLQKKSHIKGEMGHTRGELGQHLGRSGTPLEWLFLTPTNDNPM